MKTPSPVTCGKIPIRRDPRISNAGLGGTNGFETRGKKGMPPWRPAQDGLGLYVRLYQCVNVGVA